MPKNLFTPNKCLSNAVHVKNRDKNSFTPNKCITFPLVKPCKDLQHIRSDLC